MPESVSTRPLLDKLGVRPGARVALIGVEDDAFRDLLAERTDDVSMGHASNDSDLVFLGADSPDQLGQLRGLRDRIKPNGAIWVVSRKGKGATIRDLDVIDAALDAGLVDNKVVSFSPTHTSLRLVIRLRDRPSAR